MSKTAKVFFAAVYALVAIGLVMTYSASAIYASERIGTPLHFLIRQLIYVGIGTLVMFIVAPIPVHFWKDHARHIILLAIMMLVMVFLPVVGRSWGGAQRWIWVGPFNFQPAEFAKIAACLYLADYLSRKRKLILQEKAYVFLPPLALIGIICGLLLLQPDLGSCAIILFVTMILIFWSGLQMRYVVGTALIFLPVFYFLIVKVPYRMSRIEAYLNPWEDPQGSGFQMIQSMIAFGIGGVKGVGLGEGIQKLFYLPSSYNDFIFSIVGEETGLMGALAVMALYGVIFVCGTLLAEKAETAYDKLYILSLTLLIVLQALINMMVATGLVPTKGLAMPFVSYGGTSIVFNLMAVGLILAMDRHLRHIN